MLRDQNIESLYNIFLCKNTYRLFLQKIAQPAINSFFILKLLQFCHRPLFTLFLVAIGARPECHRRIWHFRQVLVHIDKKCNVSPLRKNKSVELKACQTLRLVPHPYIIRAHEGNHVPRKFSLSLKRCPIGCGSRLLAAGIRHGCVNHLIVLFNPLKKRYKSARGALKISSREYACVLDIPARFSIYLSILQLEDGNYRLGFSEI